MRNSFCLLSFLCLYILSCNKSDSNETTTPPPPPPPQVHMLADRTTLHIIGKIGSIDSFNVQSNVSWTLTISPSTATWLHASSNSGTGNAKVYISNLESNTTTGTKTATITITPPTSSSLQPVSISVTQQPYISSPWDKLFGGTQNDYINSISKANEGNFVIAGSSTSNDGDITGNHGGKDGLIFKIDESGNKLWQKTLGGSGDEQINQAIAAFVPDGHLLVGYTTSNDGDVSGNHGLQDGWIIRVDQNGNKLWQVAIGGSGMDEALSVWEMSSYYYVVGNTRSNDGDFNNNKGGQDVWILKLSMNGSKVWLKTFGGTLDDAGMAIQPTSDGNFIIAGYTSSSDGDITGNHGGKDALLIKIDADGNKIWSKTFGGTQDDVANSISLIGGFVFTGYTLSNDGDVLGNHGGTDAWMVKTDNNGNKVWSRCFGGTQNDVGTFVTGTSEGTYVMAGNTYSNDGDVSGNHGGQDGWLVRANPNDGSIALTKTFGGIQNDAFTCINQYFKNFFLTGTTLSNDGVFIGSHGSQEVWVSNFITP
jgi:hypothetical protein